MKFLFPAFLVLTFASTACAYTKGKTYKLTILHTNDHHGHFWANKDGEYGLAARATLINELRDQIKKDGGHVLLIDAGDVNTGVPQSDMQEAEPDFRGMAELQYDVMALGNHEFDNNLATIFKQRMWAGFPFISANIYYKNTSRRVFPSHITKKLDDLKVTIFGLTTEDTPIKSKAENSKHLTFVPVVDEAVKIVPGLRKESDVLIGLTHAGHYANEDRGSNAPGDVAIARAVKGIDLIVGGHTQIPLFTPDVQNGTIIVQAQDWGKYLGRVDLEVLDGKVSLKEYKLIPINLKGTPTRIAADTNMEQLLKPFKQKGDEALKLEVGFSEVEFVGTRNIVRAGETNLGNLVAEVYRAKFGADIGISNSGGIRDSIYPGKLTLESVLSVLPFGNEVGTAEIKGSELITYFTKVIFTLAPKPGETAPGGAFPQLAGIEMTANRATSTISNMKIGGVPVDANKTYKMAIPKFMGADGGDGFPKLATFKAFGFIDADILKDYLIAKKVLKATDFPVTGKVKFEN
ncbi:MAG: 5'-nucleotidase C-terminal domain-containing protein [Bdellovibrionota bacterium]